MDESKFTLSTLTMTPNILTNPHDRHRVENRLDTDEASQTSQLPDATPVTLFSRPISWYGLGLSDLRTSPTWPIRYRMKNDEAGSALGRVAMNVT
jgi:hypothetical protein